MAKNAREARRVEQENAQLATELRRAQERQRATMERTVAAWGGEQASVVQGSAFLGWKEAVAGARELRKHAERVFSVMCQGDSEATLRTSFLAWADHRRESRLQKERELQRHLAQRRSRPEGAREQLRSWRIVICVHESLQIDQEQAAQL